MADKTISKDEIQKLWIAALADYFAPNVHSNRVSKFWYNNSVVTDFKKIKEELIIKLTDNLTKPIPEELVDLLKANAPKDFQIDLQKWNIAWNNHLKVYCPISLGRIGFFNASFQEIDLSFADLSRELIPHMGDHYKANLKWAQLKFTNFSGANMALAELDKANLQHAFLIGCDLSEAKFTYANLENANLSYSNLTKANFTGANLKGANFEGAILFETNFTEANLQGAFNVEFDQSNVFRTRLNLVTGFHVKFLLQIYVWLAHFLKKIGLLSESVNVKILSYSDKWNSLRNNYTGIRSFLNIFLVIVFILPYVFKTIALKIISNAEIKLINMGNHLGVSEVILNQTTQKSYKVWQILLGVDSGNYVYRSLIIILIIYNVIRFILTFMINPLKNNEDRSFITPLKVEYDFLYRLHRVNYWIGWIALSVAFYHLFKVLSSEVLIFS